MSTKPVPIPEPEDDTQSIVSESPSVMGVDQLPYPAEHFTAEYLAQQTLDTLKAMKKGCKIRTKTEDTTMDYIRVISEWYLKKKGPKGKKPKKPATEELVSNPPVLNLDVTIVEPLATSTTEVKKVAKRQNNSPELNTTIKNTNISNITPIKLQRPTKKVLVSLTNEEREEIQINKQAKTKIYQFLDNIHDQLRGSSVTGEKAMDDIIMFIILAKLDELIYEGKFNIFDTRLESQGGAYKDTCEVMHLVDDIKTTGSGFLIKFLYNNNENIRGGTPENPDIVMQLGTLLKANSFSSNYIRDTNLFHLDNEHTLKRILHMFDKVSIKSLKDSNSNTEPTEQTEKIQEIPRIPDKKKPTKKEKQNIDIDLNALNQMDAIGTIYEYFTNKYKGNQGKDMGQYFTERMLMLMSLHLIDKEDIEEFGIDEDSTMGDEFCGTFGFPLKTREYFKKHFGINLKPENIHGVEYESKTFTLAAMNAMLSSQAENGIDKFKLERGSSFNTNLSPHLDVSVHNVPFGDTMRWSDIINYASQHPGCVDILNEHIKDKSNVDAVLSAQLVIYKTRKMGILIIKDGKETSSPKFEKFRRAIMDKCCVKKIMKIPGTAFSHTNTKTICIYFTKREGAKTESIQFCELSDKLDTITEICQVPRADLEARWCSWNPQDYLVDEHAEAMKGKNCFTKVKIGDIFDFKNGHSNSSEISNTGEYPFYAATVSNPVGTNNKFDFDEDEYILFIKSGGNSKNPISKNLGIGKVYLVHGKCAANIAVFKMTNNRKDIITTKYAYYYLLDNQEYIQTFALYATGNGNIDMTKFKRMEIPIPDLETQNDAVQALDEFATNKSALETYLKNLDTQQSRQMNYEIKWNRDDMTWMKLGELVSMENGKFNTCDLDNKGNIPFYSCKAINPIGMHSIASFDYPKYILIILAGGSSKNLDGGNIGLGNVYNVSNKSACRSGVHCLIIKNNIITYDYLYHYLKNKKLYINSKAHFTNGLGIIKPSKIEQLEIPVPPLAMQAEIVSKLELIESKKQLIKEEIARLDDLMKQTLELSYTTKHDPRLTCSANNTIGVEDDDESEKNEELDDNTNE